jgi:hypothetical protein
MSASTSVWQQKRGVEGLAKVWRTSSLTLATTTTMARQVSLNLTAFYLFYRWSLSLSLIKLVPMMTSSILVMILY